MLRLAHNIVFVVYRRNPRLPPADLPSAMAVPLEAAGIPSLHPSSSNMATMNGLRQHWCQTLALHSSKLRTLKLMPFFCCFFSFGDMI